MAVLSKMIMVRNMKDTSDEKPPSPYESWKDWWEEKTGRRFEFCSCSFCFSFAEVGAHVEKVKDSDGKSYMVPLCKPCNNKSVEESFFIDGNDLVEIK